MLRVPSNTKESTIGDIQETGEKQPGFLPFGKAEDTPSPALPRIRRTFVQPHPWTPWTWGILDFCNVGVDKVVCMVVLVGMGERMAERFLPIYLIALGGGALSIGLLNGLDNLLSALYSFPGGFLSDRLGIKRALLVFNIMAMCILIPAWQAVLVGAVFFLSWTAISLPATMSLVAKLLPKNKRTMGVSMHSLVRRIPMALGKILGGLCIGFWGERDGVRVAFAAALLLCFVAVVLQQSFMVVLQQSFIEDDLSKTASDRQSIRPEKNPLRLFKEMDSSLKRLLVSDILVRFCEQIPYAFPSRSRPSSSVF